ncbi:MAG: amino acid racemase [Nanoarchaeota archaeon]|nr:amino acid racemase [Nanoarchaeota archaeon]MBU0977570.1 amino acid racemase [Nanoarchaeota archaeon]
MTTQKNLSRRIGIVGGLGTETSCTLCLRINSRIRDASNCQPNLVMENVPMPLILEKEIIQGNPSEQIFSLLSNAVKNLDSTDVIAIPCNSVHIFLSRLREISNKILSIMEETARECKNQGLKKVGLLATRTTIKSQLHESELKHLGIETITPTEKEQDAINEVILNILEGNRVDESKLNETILNLKDQGAEAVILGCTDLQLAVKDSPLPVIDTLKVLEDAVVRFLTK